MDKIFNNIWTKIKEISDTVRQKPMLVYGIGCLLLAVFSFFFTYYLRVIYSPAWLGQIKGTLVISAAFIVLWTAFCRAARFKDRNMPLFMSLLLFVLGMVFVYATPPNQVPDENTHFLRSYTMAQGQWGFDENHQFPDDVNLLIKHFPVAYNNGYKAREGATVYHRFVNYFADVENGGTAGNMGIFIFQVIPYIPGAAGIFIAKLVGFGALGAFYANRIANLVFFCLCAYFALKFAGRFRVILFTLMSLPLMIFMAASCNSDSFLFALMFLMFATVLSDSFDNVKAVIFALCLAVLTTCKMSYVVFFPLVFCVPKEKWALKIKDKNISRLVYLAFSLVVFVLIYQGMALYVQAFSNYGVIQRPIEDSQPMAQLMFILKNPLRYIAVFADTLKNNAFFLFSGGLLGWMDVNLPLISYCTPLVVLLACVKQAGVFRREDINKTVIFLICSLLTYGVVMTGLYLSWTPVTLPQIIGLQMRYMYPAFMGICMVIGQYFSTRTKENVKNTDYSCICTNYVFTVIAAVLMLIVYYLPERAVVFVA
ncbi:MAG: DUF2142 domain-containing protein [Ruminococcaceae bacterium]|nr:DUF2142 domain-containing protein [Oscillospiraceae bacterium]